MAFLTTNALCIPVMGAAVPSRSLIIARASCKSAEHQEPAAMADGAHHASGRRRAVMLFGAATALTASTAISQSARAACLLGGWCDIKDVTEPRIQDLGKWAVTKHNLQAGSDLQFVAVTSGKEQVVKGMNYNLVIETKGSGKWVAVLFDPLPGGKRELNWFKRLLG